MPHNLQAEQSVLGSILLKSDFIGKVISTLRAEHFHFEKHQKLYSVLYNMYINNSPIDIITALDSTLSTGVFGTQDEAKTYLYNLAKGAIFPSSFEDYAKIIIEKARMRSLANVSLEIHELAMSPGAEPSEIIENAEKMIFDLRTERDIGGLVHIKDLIENNLAAIAENNDNPDNKNGETLSTSYPDLDRIIYGLNPSDLIIVAGRPAMGKTAFALNVAVGAAKLRPDKEVVIFSLEMSSEQLVSRVLSAESRVPSEQIRSGNVDREQWQNIRNSVANLSQLEVYVDDFSNLSIGALKAKLRRMKNLGVVVIDYLQLMSTGRKDGNRTLEVGEITCNLKLLAKEFNVPVILVSQLSRGTESRSDKRPMLSDLRDSGSIEQDADIVLFMYRESYYNKNAEPNLSECIVAKNRQGSTGTVQLHWKGRFTKFSTLEYRYEA